MIVNSVSKTGIFPPLELKSFPPIQETESKESIYWNNYSITKQEKLVNSPSYIHFNSTSDSYIITHSTMISLYNSSDDKLQRSYSRFQDDAYSGKFRKDCKLILSGDKEGNIKVFDVKTKSMLRQLKGHNEAVRSTNWTCEGLYMISGSDDRHVKRWDLGTQEMIWDSKVIHSDYIRSTDTNPTASDIFISGSYDHSVKLWDSRTKSSIHSFNHKNPVEYAMFSPSGSMIFSCSGNEVSMWDVISGKCIHTFCNHQKNITSLCMNNDGSKLLSCSLDGFVKIYSIESLEVLHGIKYNGPLISLALANDDSKLIVGQVDGNVVIKNKSTTTDNADIDFIDNIITESKLLSNKYYKGSGIKPSNSKDAIFESDRAVRLKPYETNLRKFNYSLALDSALKSRNPIVVVTVLEELSRRDGLTKALSGRDEITLEPLLSFLSKYISNPRFSYLIIQVTHRLLDMYSGVIGHSDAIDELFVKLHDQVTTEVGFQRQIMKVMGTLDSIINVSLISSSNTSDNNIIT